MARVHPVVVLAGRAFGVSVADILGPGRPQRVSRARYAVVHVLRQLRGLSWSQVADILNLTNHSSVAHGERRAAELIASDPAFAAGVAQMMAQAEAMSPAEVRGFANIVLPRPAIRVAAPDMPEFVPLDDEEYAHRRMMRHGSAALRDALQRVAA